MEHVLYGLSYSLAREKGGAGEEISAESGAMVSMCSGIEMQTGIKGGVFSGLKRKLLGGESFFINIFRASAPGDIMHLELSGTTLFVQSSSYLASSPQLTVDTKWAGAKGFFTKEGLLSCSKPAAAGNSSPRAMAPYIHGISLGAGDSYTVDNGHMVAFDESVDYRVPRVGGLKSMLSSDERACVCSYGPDVRSCRCAAKKCSFCGLSPTCRRVI